MRPNVKINYLYRDAGNYKLYGSKIFSNNSDLTLEVIREKIQALLTDGLYFEPEKLGVERLMFDEPDDELDHEWHEIENIEFTSEQNEGADIVELMNMPAVRL